MPLLDLSALAALRLARTQRAGAPKGLGGRLLVGCLGALALSGALALGVLAGQQALCAPVALGPWLDRLGFAGVADVRQGKRFELEVEGDLSDEQLEKIAADVLTNTVIEDFTITRVTA